MSHETSKTIEIDGKHYVINTAGFRSLKAAKNAAFSKKNLKRKRPVPYDTEDEATAASKKRSRGTDKKRRRNTEKSGYLGFYERYYENLKKNKHED